MDAAFLVGNPAGICRVNLSLVRGKVWPALGAMRLAKAARCDSFPTSNRQDNARQKCPVV